MNTVIGRPRTPARLRERARRMALTHRVLIVAGPIGVEFHLDHRIAADRGQHRILGPAGLAAWMADAGDIHPAFAVAATCPCRRSRPPTGVLRQGERPCPT